VLAARLAVRRFVIVLDSRDVRRFVIVLDSRGVRRFVIVLNSRSRSRSLLLLLLLLLLRLLSCSRRCVLCQSPHAILLLPSLPLTARRSPPPTTSTPTLSTPPLARNMVSGIVAVQLLARSSSD
jgi:hypothetical protein